jgi:hypothetical protein
LVVNDAYIIRLVERIGEHYRSNIFTRFVRPALLQLPIEKQTWNLIEELTEKIEHYRYQGFPLDELYRQVAAAARFISVTRRDLLPVLRNRISTPAGSDRVLRDMAVNNFGSNLKVFTDMINELYLSLLGMDKKDAKGRKPVYLSIPELADVSSLLAGF